MNILRSVAITLLWVIGIVAWTSAILIACVFVYAVLSPPAHSQQLAANHVRVIDGDTIVMGVTHIRLWGIDAPELSEMCADGYQAGRAARDEMERLTFGGSVLCEGRGRDRYGRTVGLCTVNGRDVQRDMVRQGLAWAFVKYSRDYMSEEAYARAAKIGVWAHHCEKAWDYRRRR